MGKSVENGILKSASVSATKKHQACPTLYYFRYVEGRPEPQGKGAEESEACHGRVEHYLSTGENVLGPIELKAQRRGLFPEPGKPGPYPYRPKKGGAVRLLDIMIEEPLRELSAAGVPFVGFIDNVDPRRVATEGLIVVNDWKFKTGVDKYGTTAERLCDPNDEDGIQMIGYGEEIRRRWVKGEFPGLKTVCLRHVQVEKGPRDFAEPVEKDIPVEEFEVLWREIEARIPEMQRTAAAQGPEQTRGNLTACWKYGGCPHRDVCPHFKSPKQSDRLTRIAQLLSPTRKGDVQMGILAKRNTVTPAPAVATQSATPPPAPAQATASATPAAPPPAPTVTAATPTPAPVKHSLIIDESTTPDEVMKANPNTGKPVAAVLPPDAPKPTKTAVPAAAPAMAAPVSETTQSGSDVPSATPAAQAEPAAPKRRGRPPKGATAQADAPAMAATAAHPAGTGFSLYIGCAPRGKPTASLMTYIEGIEGLALEKFRTELKDRQGNPIDVDDIRLSYGEDVGFGKWKPVLQAFARENPPAPGRYYVLGLGADERVDTVVAALEGMAVEVVQ